MQEDVEQRGAVDPTAETVPHRTRCSLEPPISSEVATPTRGRGPAWMRKAEQYAEAQGAPRRAVWTLGLTEIAVGGGRFQPGFKGREGPTQHPVTRTTALAGVSGTSWDCPL